MGNTLEAYRAAIETFHLTTHRLISPSVPKFNIRFSIYCAVSIWCLLGLKCFVKNDKFALYRVLLLLMCMDVKKMFYSIQLMCTNFSITKTYLYNIDPHKPHFYIVKLGFTGVYIIFLISAQKHRLWVLVRTASPRRF